jgi:hypothetical protein
LIEIKSERDHPLTDDALRPAIAASADRRTLIHIKAQPRGLGAHMPMAGEDRKIVPDCPVCARPMAHHHTIRRAFAPNVEAFRCTPCNISVHETERGERRT